MQINRYTRQVMTQNTVAQTYDAGAVSRAGAITGAVGDITGQIAAKMQETSDNMWLNEAIIQRKKSAIDSSYTERNNFTDNPYGFSNYMEKKYGEYDAEILKSAPSESAKKAYQQQAMQDNLALYNQNKAWEFNARVEDFDRKYKRSAQSSQDIARINGMNGDNIDPSLSKNMDSLSAGAKDLYSDEQLLIMNEETKRANYDAYIQGLITKDPKRAIKKLNNEYSAIPQNATFEDAVKSVFDFEGGYVANDAGAGPTLYGINSKANPKEFEEILALEQSGKKAQAKDMAKQVYKSKYWDAIGADKLDPQLAYVAMDSAVNMGVGATKEMLSKSGGDVYAFLDARRSLYESIAKNNPDKAENLNGWMNRVDELEMRLSGGIIHADRQSDLIDAAKVEIKKQGNEYKQKFNVEWNAIETASAAGVRIDDARLDGLKSELDSYDLQDEAREVSEFKKTQKQVYDFAKMPLKEQQDYLKTKKKEMDSGDIKEASQYKAISKAYETKIDMIKKDPWSYYSQAGVLDVPQNLPYGDDNAMNAALARRRAGMKIVKERDGIDVPILTKTETEALYDTFNSGDVQKTVSAINQYKGILTGEERATLAAGLKGKSGLFASVIVQDDPTIAEQILQGSKIEKSAYTKDSLSKDLYSKLESAVLDPVALGAYTDAIYSQYKFLSMQAGTLQDKEVDEDRLDKAISDIIGNVQDVSVGGMQSKVILPKDMTDTDFENIFLSADDASFKASSGSYAFAGGKPVSYNDLIENSKIFSTGNGRYGFLIDGIGYAYDNNGNILEVDIQKLKGALPNGVVRQKMQLSGLGISG